LLHHALPQDLSALCELSEANLLEATKTDERSTHEELRCVLAVVRHGDRTPKQKLKVRNASPHGHALRRSHFGSRPDCVRKLIPLGCKKEAPAQESCSFNSYWLYVKVSE
jgi:hypothetical protein